MKMLRSCAVSTELTTSCAGFSRETDWTLAGRWVGLRGLLVMHDNDVADWLARCGP